MFRFNLKKHLPEFPDIDGGDLFAIFGISAICFSIYIAITSCEKWLNRHVTSIIGVENLKIDNTGRWVGSNNPNLQIDFNKQRKVNRVMHDGDYTVIYTTDKNYKVKPHGKICTPDNMNPNLAHVCDPDNSRNRFKYTKKVYEIVETDGEDVYHWVCSSNFGNCARYEVKTK